MLPFYGDSTMWGPQPEKERKRLQPGDRMADGRIFMGNDPVAVLETALERVELEMKPLQNRRDEILAKLAEVAPEKYGTKGKAEKPAEAPEAAEASSPRKAKRAS